MTLAASAGDVAANAVSPNSGQTTLEIHSRLRDAILTGELRVGESISQVKLAQRLGVSRTPLREALRLLEREGLVDARPNRRPRIAGISPVDLDDLYGSRIMLESLAISLSTQRTTGEDVSRMRQLLVEMDEIALTRDVAAWEVPHGEFHDLLICHVGERLRQTAADLRDHGRRYRAQILTSPLAWDEGAREHADIVEAVSQRDSAGAAELLALHYARTALTLITRMAPQHQAASVCGALAFIQPDAS